MDLSSISDILANLGFNLNTAILVTANFLLVWLILEQFVFKRLRAAMQERREVLAESLENAEELKSKLNKAEEKAQAIIAAATKEANEFKKKQKAEYEAWESEARENAQADIERMRKEAREQLEQERIEMLNDLKAEVAELALSATQKIIGEKFDAKQDKVIVEEYLDQLDG